MNFDPGIKLSRIERILERRASNFRALKLLSFEDGRPDECDADNECAAGFDELAAGQSSFINFDGAFSGVGHGLLPLSHKRRGMFNSVHDRDVTAAATKVRRRAFGGVGCL